jgi:uncharacterized damage-inducible protein DinB
VESPWIEAFKYHRWANAHLLEQCTRLSDSQLELTAPGTYGTIAATWLHLLGAQERYNMRLGGGEPTISGRDGFPGLAAIKEHLSRSDDELIELAGKVDPNERAEVKGDDGPVTLPKTIILVQALHHGNDHRTHICSVLGHHGFEYGEMDVWAFADASDVVVPVSQG